MQKAFARVRGTKDYINGQQKLHDLIFSVLKATVLKYNLVPISTSVLQPSSLFKRQVNTNEMFTLDEEISLRPEGTACVVRSLIEDNFKEHRVFYCGPMFRRERPQLGRFRQFTQFGVELFANEDPLCDVECIEMANECLNSLGTKEHKLLINSIGDENCRSKYSKELEIFLKDNSAFLSKESKEK